MASLEQKLQEFERRPAVLSGVKEKSRIAMFQHFSAINKFEGLVPTAIDTRLFHLLAAGKITKQEYIDLCLMDARGTA